MSKIAFTATISGNNMTKHFALVVLLFFGLFYLLFPLSISRLVGKPATFLDWFQASSKGVDYVATYVASKSLLDGQNIYLNNASLGDQYRDPFAGGQYSRYSYPPLQALIMSPLSFLPFQTSYATWTLISALLILVSIILIAQLTTNKKLTIVFLTLFFGLSSFFWFQVERGQTDALLLLFMTLFIYLFFKKRNLVWAALFFALAILLKVFPLLFVLFFILRKEYKFLIYTALFALLIIFITGFGSWAYWLSDVLPNYANYYLGNEVDHSLAYLISGFWDKPFPQIVRIAQLVSVFLVLVYLAVGLFNRNKGQNAALLELAALSIIAEISTPWSANYKLVTLILLFAAPLFVMELKTVKNRVLMVLPLLIVFVFLSPIYNEYYGRFLFSLLANVVPGDFIAYHPMQKIAEFRVAIALLVCLLYLFFLQIYAFFQPKFSGLKLALAGLIVVFATGSLLVYWQAEAASTSRIAYRQQVNSYGEPKALSDDIALAGFEVTKNLSGSYDIELIIKVNKVINHHYAFYIHGRPVKANNTEGINFFPYILVSSWPAGKYVVIHKTVNLTPAPQRITFGLFDLSDGRTYGNEGELGVINLDELK